MDQVEEEDEEVVHLDRLGHRAQARLAALVVLPVVDRAIRAQQGKPHYGRLVIVSIANNFPVPRQE